MTIHTKMRRAASGLWTPEEITGLQLWANADDVASVGDGGSVASWTTRVGGYTYSEATNRPLARASGVGGKWAVDFDGTNDALTRSGALFSNTAGTVMIVHRLDALGNCVAYANRLAGGTRLVYFGIVTAGHAQFRQRDNDTADNLRSNTTTPGTTTDYCFTYESSGTAQTFEINGVNQAITVIAGANNGDWYGDTASRDQTAIGWNGVGEFWNGKIRHIFDFNHKLTSGEKALMEAWITKDSGITFS